MRDLAAPPPYITILRYFGRHFYENTVHAAAKMRLYAMEPPVPLIHVR